MTIMESILTILFFIAVALIVWGLIYKSIKLVISVTVISVIVFVGSLTSISQPEEPQDTIIIDDVQEVSDFADYKDLADDYAITVLTIVESANDALESNDLALAEDVKNNAQTVIDEINAVIEAVNASNMSSMDKNILIPIYKEFISSLERVINFMDDMM